MHVTEVQKHFCNHHKPNGWLSECKESVKPQFPNDTRWKSQLTCLDTFIKNRTHYMIIVQDHEDEMDANIAKKIQDFKNAQDLAAQLRPIGYALDKSQSRNCSNAVGCRIWIQLKVEPVLEQNIWLQKNVIPDIKVKKLTMTQMNTVNEWLVAKDPKYIWYLIAYEAKASPFPPFFTDNAVSLSPVT